MIKTLTKNQNINKPKSCLLSRFAKNIKEIFFPFILIISVIFTIAKSKDFLAFSKEAADVFAATVLPAVLPFSLTVAFFKTLINEEVFANNTDGFSKKFFGFSGKAGVAVFYGLISGAPAGIAAARLLPDKDDFIKAAFLSSVPSPLLVIACIGKISYKSFITGGAMYLSAIISTIILYKSGVFINRAAKNPPYAIKSNFKNTGSAEIKNSLPLSCFLGLAESFTLTVLFYVISCFAVKNVMVLVKPFIKNNTLLLNGIIAGLIETTSGCNFFCGDPGAVSASLSMLTLTMGGLPSIIPQLNALKENGVKRARFLLFKTAQSLLTFVLCLIFLTLPALFR